MSKLKLWVTYAWKDNEKDDVDYFIQELETELDVRYDRKVLAAGTIMWEEFGKQISEAENCDAWLGIISASALASSKWREELYYALDRALQSSKTNFPIMFLVLGEVPTNLPPVARVRLYVSNAESDWALKIVAGAKGEAAPVPSKTITPYTLCAYDMGNGVTSFEFALRAGTWSKWWVAESVADAKIVKVTTSAPRTPRTFGMWAISGPNVRGDARGWEGHAPALSPTMAVYVEVTGIPKGGIAFGELGKPESVFTMSSAELVSIPVGPCL